ncbi:MAG: type II toxin-antitoxin system death-on-curing family toxin [Candidatus Kerfeldbacteria bacterium]|nr:type II toxin-antitoxin system death-on-curing family toxin [Candidatus Kerfeldbacteria bacterium]
MPRKIVILTVDEIQYLAHRLAKETMDFDEPIPEFSTRYPGKLESCIVLPFQKFARRSLYPTMTQRAAMLFYLLIKNHPFQNGNKRIAITSLFVYLYKNKRWLRVDTQELYNFAVWVASSPSKLKDEVVTAIDKFILFSIVKL